MKSYEEELQQPFPVILHGYGLFLFSRTMCLRPGSHASKPPPPQKDGPVMRQMFL